MNNETKELLKLDALGRVWTTRERREWLLDEFDRSGVAAAEFARVAGIKYPTFASWVRRRRRATGDGCPAMDKAAFAARARRRAALTSPQFVEARIEREVVAPRGGVALRVELPGGVRMEIADASQAKLAAVLLRALEQEEEVRPC